MRNQATKAFIYWVLASSLFVFTATNCSSGKSEYTRLENYYRENTALHAIISDSLIAFCRANQTKVILSKKQVKESAISFQIYFAFNSTFYPVYYDSVLNRHDPYPEKTTKYNIPFSVIESFDQSTYSAISADSTKTFFGGKWDVKFQLGTHGDSQYGILISSDTSISGKCVKRLSSKVCLTTSAIH